MLERSLSINLVSPEELVTELVGLLLPDQAYPPLDHPGRLVMPQQVRSGGQAHGVVGIPTDGLVPTTVDVGPLEVLGAAVVQALVPVAGEDDGTAGLVKHPVGDDRLTGPHLSDASPSA